jgi:hypothetical protein
MRPLEMETEKVEERTGNWIFMSDPNISRRSSISLVCARVRDLERACKFNAGYYVSKVLTSLSEW